MDNNVDDKRNVTKEIFIESSETSQPISFHRKCIDQKFLSLDFFGRFLTGTAFIFYGYSFIYFANGSALYIPAFVPYPFFWVISFGILIMISGLILITNQYLRKAIIFLTVTHSIVTILTYLLYTEFQILILNIALIGGLVTLLSKHPTK